MLHLCLLSDTSVATKSCHVLSLGITSSAAGNNHLGIFLWCNKFFQTKERWEQGYSRTIGEGGVWVFAVIPWRPQLIEHMIFTKVAGRRYIPSLYKMHPVEFIRSSEVWIKSFLSCFPWHMLFLMKMHQSRILVGSIVKIETLILIDTHENANICKQRKALPLHWKSPYH